MTRKPVQIISGPEDSLGPSSLYVLCDDGTIWEKPPGEIWVRLPDIPQDEPVPPSWDATEEAIETYLKSRRREARFEPVSIKDKDGNHIGFVDRERK